MRFFAPKEKDDKKKPEHDVQKDTNKPKPLSDKEMDDVAGGGTKPPPPPDPDGLG